MRGSISRKGNLYYYIIYYGRNKETGKKKYVWSKGYKTKKEAEDGLALELGSIVQDGFVSPDKILLSEYIHQWLESYCKMNLKDTTYDGYFHNLTKHVIPSIGDIPIQELKPFHLQTLYHKLLTKGRTDGKGGLSGKTVGQIHRILGKLLNDAVRLEIIKKNVSKSVNPPKAKRHEMKVIRQEDVIRFIELYENNKIYIAVLLALNLGLRRGEALGLAWNCVDFDNKTIRISKNLVSTKQGIKLTDPKTANSRRTLMISDYLIEKLKSQKRRQEEYKELYGDEYTDSGFVVTRDNGTCIHPGRFSHNFKDVILASEWAKEKYSDICYHCLRHYVECFVM